MFDRLENNGYTSTSLAVIPERNFRAERKRKTAEVRVRFVSCEDRVKSITIYFRVERENRKKRNAVLNVIICNYVKCLLLLIVILIS